MKKLLFALSLAVLVSGAAFADGGKKHASCAKGSASCCHGKAEKTAKVEKAAKKTDRKTKA